MKKLKTTLLALLLSVSAIAVNVTDQATLKTALTNGKPITFANDITITDSLPFTNQPIKQKIDGNNFKLIVQTPTGTALYKYAANVSTANGSIDFAPEICNIIFQGTKGKGTAIVLGASYGAYIHDNWFKGFAIGIKNDFCLNNTIQRNRFWSQSFVCVWNGFKGIPGGNGSTTQSNVATISENCFRVDSGAFAAIWCEASSGQLIQHNVIEGGNDAHYGSQYGIYFDYVGSPNVKSVVVAYNHFEVVFTKSRFYCRLGDGNIFYFMNYYQYPGNDIELVSDQQPVVHAWWPDWLPTPTTNLAQGGLWEFRNYPWPFNETQTQYWKNGIVPYYRDAKGYGEGADKYEFFRANPQPKLNGKNYVTQ